MRILLDTHALIWAVVAPDNLGSTSKAIVLDRASDIRVSICSLWELAIKIRLGKLPDYLSAMISAVPSAGYQMLPVETRHVLMLRTLPQHHRDPFDQMLIAQAAADGLTLMTNDRKMAAYEVPLIDARS